MNKDDIISMAQDAGLCAQDGTSYCPLHYLELFATLVAAAEREACANVCEKQANDLWQKNCDSEGHGADQCAAAIRARSNHD